MRVLTLHSPAKLNLFLRICGKRQDGYHALASLFQTIDLCDILHFQLAERDVLTCTDVSLPTDHNNLILKAVALFRAKTAWQGGLAVHLEKKIPHQAGLGGGSGNAATALWALNALCRTHIPLQQLMLWGAEIGSDVPSFLSRGTAYCTGRGEQVHDLPPLQPQRAWIVKPAFGLPTAQVYKQLNISSLPPRDPLKALDAFSHGGGDFFNDLEEAAMQVNPQAAALKQKLCTLGFDTVLMCGSGSSFFCIGGMEAAFASLNDVQIFPTAFINRTENRWYCESN